MTLPRRRVGLSDSDRDDTQGCVIAAEPQAKRVRWNGRDWLGSSEGANHCPFAVSPEPPPPGGPWCLQRNPGLVTFHVGGTASKSDSPMQGAL